MADQATTKRHRDELSDGEEERDLRAAKATKTNDGHKLEAGTAASEPETVSSKKPADHDAPRAATTIADKLPLRFKEKTQTQSMLPRKIRKPGDVLPLKTANGMTAAAPAPQQPTPATGHTLIPIDHTRRRAMKGQKDESILRVQCRYADTGVGKELCYTKQLHAEIDWDSPQDIASINAWIGQIYTRAGFRKKTVSTWHPDEEFYIELYHFLMIAMAQLKPIEKMNNRRLYEDFNYFFANRVLKGKDGRQLGPRAKRLESSIASKLVRLVGDLKIRFDEVWEVTEDAGFHEPYRPRISPELLEEWKAAKESLVSEEGHLNNLLLEKWALAHITKQSAATDLVGVASPRQALQSATFSSSNASMSMSQITLASAAHVNPQGPRTEGNDDSTGPDSANGDRAARNMTVDENYDA